PITTCVSPKDVCARRARCGLGDFLSVLDAERSLYQAEDQLVDSQRAVTQNLVALYKALGGGWEAETRLAELKPKARSE
ncbi:MAG TPA: TolC family protein, partial [Candidatus Binatia bacterium]|nr:TolC family protein [Candidatus Binatia bacterium]